MRTRDTHVRGRRRTIAHVGRRDLVRLLVLLVLLSLMPLSSAYGLQGAVAGAAEPRPTDRAELGRQLALARSQLQEAKNLGGKKQLPESYQTAKEALSRAETALAGDWDPSRQQEVAGVIGRAATLAVRLLGRARFVKDVRAYRHEWEEVAGRFDHLLGEVGAAVGFTPEPSLMGRAAANALVDHLRRHQLRQQVQTDSLELAVRLVDQRYRSQQAVQESTITSLRVEVSHLRRRLWETELRAGMAEADRSAAETDLDQRRLQEEAIRALGKIFGPAEGEVLLTPGGEVIMRLYGFSFAVGSAELRSEQEGLLNKLKTAIEAFGGCRLRVEGHTDDTGGREANLRLSRRRAETVARQLGARLGLAQETMETVGHGPDRPIASNATAEGRARNRRIDVVLLPGE